MRYFFGRNNSKSGDGAIGNAFEVRKCVVCGELKEHQAFVRTREVCRSCWYYLPDDEKRASILYIPKKKGEPSKNNGDKD